MWARMKFTCFYAITLLAFGYGGTSFAQPADAPPPCTPGIPCTIYTPDTDANADKADFKDLRKTCDGDVMNQIHARAFLESQRENMMNQIAVRKPDSILSYTCYDQFIGVAAKVAPPIFSESTRWSGMSVKTSVTGKPPEAYPPTRTLNVNMGEGSIVPLINGMALGPASNFARDNFAHDYLGGTAGFAYPVAGSVQKRDSLDCDRMQQVWQVAKCQNLNVDPFPSFEEILESDPRTLVGSCNNPRISQEIIDVAANKAPPYPEYKVGEITDPYPFVRVDGIRHLNDANKFDYFDPKLGEYIVDGGDTDSSNCAPAIKTGVKLLARVNKLDASLSELEDIPPEEYEDAICPNPHCFLNKVGTATNCLPQ